MTDRPKRLREVPPTEEDILHKARMIMHEDPFKDCASQEETRRFKALFGCRPVVALCLWLQLVKRCLVPEQGTIMHLLWTLMFHKVYATEATMKKLTGGADEKTTRKWVGDFVTAIQFLEPFVVS